MRAYATENRQSAPSTFVSNRQHSTTPCGRIKPTRPDLSKFDDLLNDTEGLAKALASIQLNLRGKQREHLGQLYGSADGEAARRDSVTRVVQSVTRSSCSTIGGQLSRFFGGEGPLHKMMWIGFIKKDARGNERWVMRHQIRAALQSLNWFGSSPEVETSPSHAEVVVTASGAFQLEFEERVARFALTEVRQQQAAFRSAVFRACGGICAISGCSVPEVLEAAHLQGRKWREGHNAQSDGILLRRDLHALYDSTLLSIDLSGKVHIHRDVIEHYGQFQDVQILFWENAINSV